jgi:hypothetical protein
MPTPTETCACAVAANPAPSAATANSETSFFICFPQAVLYGAETGGIRHGHLYTIYRESGRFTVPMCFKMQSRLVGNRNSREVRTGCGRECIHFYRSGGDEPRADR